MKYLEVRNLRVKFDSRYVLRNVSLILKSSTISLLAGPSGSGKTTLLRVLSGIIPNVIKAQVEGHISPRPEELRSKRLITYIPQEPWFSIVTNYVWSEVALFTRLRLLDEIRDLLKKYGIEHLVERPTYNLSSGELQRLNFAIAEANERKFVFLDEPTSHLDSVNAEKVIKGIERLRSLGASILVIDHNLKKWKSLTDTRYYLDNGYIRTLHMDEDPYEYWNKLIESLDKPEVGDKIVCSVYIERFRYPDSNTDIIRNIKFDVREGEIVLIKGPSGSGKSTLLRLIAQKFCNRYVDIEINAKYLYIPDNPLLYFSGPTPLEELGSRGVKYLELLGLRHIAHTPILRLSTGERRRVAIASALSRGAKLVIIDEPTIGLDPKSKYLILKSMLELSKSNKVAFIIASHDQSIEVISNEVINLG